MNRLKQIMTAGFLLLGMGLCAGKAYAANPDTMTVSVTPSVTFGVSITSVTAGSGYNFGTVALGVTTISTAAIVLTNSGNVSEYFSMAISNTSGGWTASAVTPTTDTFRMYGYINATQPVSGTFVDTLAVPPVPGAAAALYGQASTKTAPGAPKNLWLRLDMPTALNTGTSAAQTMTLTVNGQGS